MKRFKITVAGAGYVGLVAGVCFAKKGHEVICVDVDEEKVSLMERGISPIYEPGIEELLQEGIQAKRLSFTTDYRAAYADADAIFIGVGTPKLPDGSADLSGLAMAVRQISESIGKECLVVVKSTVPVGTGDKVEQFMRDFLLQDVHVEVASNPEFLSQGSAVNDTLHAARIVIGTESKWAKKRLTEIYEDFCLPIVAVSRRSAEMIKYACNNFLALKISYMNEIANLCEAVGANIEDVAKGMAYDKRIGNSFLRAGIGYGGSCLPKDTRALSYLAGQNGCRLKTVEAAMEVNEEQKTRLFMKASKRVITFCGLTVAVLGLAFKPETDDAREAPSLENVRLLLEAGARVQAYDPFGTALFEKYFSKAEGMKGELCYAASAQEALSGANLCFILTEWKEFQQLMPADYKKLMRTPLVYDGRNLYDPLEMKQAGVEYDSIGRQEKTEWNLYSKTGRY